MGRSTIVCCGLLASLVFASGCGTTGRMNPMAWLRNGQRSRTEAGKKLAAHNPFKRKAKASSDEVSDRSQTEQGDDRAAGSHDADLKQFIADELQDASPEERDELIADLRSLDPQLVRQILKLRRMRIRLEQQQLARNPERDPNRPVRGLGAPFPGSEQRQFADLRPEIGRGTISRSTSNVKQSQFERRDFGHTQTASANVNVTSAENRAFAPGPPPPDLPILPAGESFPVRNSESVGRTVRERADNLTLRWGADSAESEAYAPAFSSNRRPSLDSPQQRLGTPSVPNGFGQFGEQLAPTGRRSNPLELTGIDTSPVFRQRRNIASTASMRRPFAGTGEIATEANAALLRTIVVAEEQAYESQIAWEQAEQLPPGSADDLPGREQAISARKQNYVEKQVYLRLLYLMSGQQARSLERIVGLEPADQEFWTQMLWSMVNYFDVEGIPNQDERATETISQLRTAIQKLQENARLKIRNVNFCRKILSYGNYETFESDKFRPKQSVLIYAEIENFASERRTDGIYRTQLKSTIEIRKGGQQGGEAVKTIEFDATTDLCRNHRHDYFHSYELQIPAGLQGNYVLVLIVEDQLSKRVATYSRNFTVE